MIKYYRFIGPKSPYIYSLITMSYQSSWAPSSSTVEKAVVVGCSVSLFIILLLCFLVIDITAVIIGVTFQTAQCYEVKHTISLADWLLYSSGG